MAINDKHGDSGDDMDFDFDEFDFDEYDESSDGDDRSPKGRLKKYGSLLKEEALSSTARRQYLEDALPKKYHTTLNSANSILDAGSDLYNDSVMREWEKSRGTFKKVVKSEGALLRRLRLNKLVDWAEKAEDDYTSDYDPIEAEVQRGMGTFGGSLKDAMNGGQLSSRERMEMMRGFNAEADIDEDKEAKDTTYQDTTVKQQTATVSMLTRIFELTARKVDYQDQIDFNYKKKMIEFNIRSLINQRRDLEQNALIRAELKEGLAAIAKNTGLPDYVKITSQENAKRLLRDKMVNAASDWAGNKISGIARSFMDQTKRNIATMGVEFRDKAGMYTDGKEMLDSVGMGIDELLVSLGAGFLRSEMSKRGGKYARRFIEKNHKYTGGLDFTEALLANSGAYANMSLSGRSGYQKFDNLLNRFGYTGLGNTGNTRIVESMKGKEDEAAFMSRKLESTFLYSYPAWFNKIWKSIEGLRTGKDPGEIDDQDFDFKYKRLRSRRDLQTEFDNEAMDENRLKNYHDGIDNWINQLDPKSTLSPEARKTIRKWLIVNHSRGKESFAVELYRGEGLPKGTSQQVRSELENKVPYLAGFDPLGVSASMKEGVPLEIETLRQNPEYRKKAKALGNADAQARSRHPIDNKRLASLTQQYGQNYLVDSGYGQYDRSGNVNISTDNITQSVLGGGMRNYAQKSNMDMMGDIETIPGMDPTKTVANDDRVPIRNMGRGMGRERYESWAKNVLGNINGHRPRGFASGGFTSGSPDEVAGVTHGDEAVVDSTGTKNNKRLLAGIMKLGASVIKNGKLNRTYYKYLGFTSPEQVDAINNLKDLDLDALHEQAEKLKEEKLGKIKSRVKSAHEKFKELRGKHFHNDGYNAGFGPTPEFTGPVRPDGFSQNLRGAADLFRDRDELIKRLKREQRIRDLPRNIREFDYSRIPRAGKEYAERAKDAVRQANVSSRLDFGATREAIERSLNDGSEKDDGLISLYLVGQSSPFITKGDFATGRYRNKTDGSIITKPADIMDDIVLVHDNGDFETIATLADMKDGVYTTLGREVKLLGLEEGYRKYLKRTSIMAAAIKNTRAVQTAIAIKEKIWDDKPVDVCIVVNGNLATVLKASGFLSAQYLDAESGDILKSHNDIRGEVVNLQGETLLTLEELASGLFDNDGYRLTISKLKHYRNIAVTKIETFVKKRFGELRDKALTRAVGWLEKQQSDDVYVMRWGGTGRTLAKAFSSDDLAEGVLIDVRSGDVIKKLADIKGPVYSKLTKSVVVKDDELEQGFFNEDGTPYKDWKGMSLSARLQHQKDRLTNRVTGFAKKTWDDIRKGYKGSHVEVAQDEEEGIGDEPCDVYIREHGDLILKLSKQDFIDHALFDVAGKVIEKPKHLLSTVFSAGGRILLTTAQITAGVYNELGVPIKTARTAIGPSKEHIRSNRPSLTTRIKNFLGFTEERETVDGSKPIDVYIFHEGKFKKLMNADNFTMGSYVDANGKVINTPGDIDGAVFNSNGQIVLTEDELQQGIYNQMAKLIGTKFYKRNGTPGKDSVRSKLGGLAKRIGSGLGSGLSKLNGLRKGSWQWMQAKKEEAERNKKGDVNVTVQNGKDDKKGFLGKLLGGLGMMFGGMFTKMMLKFKNMFKNVRNAILLSKIAGAAGGALGGGVGTGKMGLLTKLAGAGIAAGGMYGAHQMLSDSFDDDVEGTSSDEQKLIEAAGGDTSGGLLSTLSDINSSTGGLAGDLAMTAAAGYGAKKVFGGGAADGTKRGLLSRLGRGAGSALGKGAGDAAKGVGFLGRMAGRAGRFLPGVARIGAKGVGLAARGAAWTLNPIAAAKRLSTVGSLVKGVGKVAMGGLRLGRFLMGPAGLAIGAAAWIGGKLWENYKNKKNPLMRFRMAQYGFDFDDEEYTSKLLDLENLMSRHVSVNGEGQPSIKDSFPEDQVLELFEVNPDDPKNQEHTQRFIAWWIKRFKPVFLSYVKQTNLLLKKFDISQIDDELNKTDKLTLLKGVNFTSQQNNPYSVSPSPFKDPSEVPLTLDDVEKAYIKALKFINKMPDDKSTRALPGKDAATSGEQKSDEEAAGEMTWLGRTKTAITDMGNETMKVTSILASKTDDLFGNWFSRASDNIKSLWGGLGGWLTSAADKLSAKMSEIWKGLSDKSSSIMDKIAGSSTVGEMAVKGTTGMMDAVGGAWDSAKSALGFESNLGDGEKHVLAAAKEAGITNPTELAALLATTAHESGNFRHTEENLRYSASSLRKTWPSRFRDPAYAEQVAKGGPQAVANAVYGGRMGNTAPGDGWKYRGRGYIQLTGKANYAQFSKDTGIDALNNPDLVARPDIGAKAAVWFWKKNGKISQAAQRGDITAVTKVVNGGLNGLSDRKNKFQKYLGKLQSGDLKTNVTAPPVVAKSAPASSAGGTAAKTPTAPAGASNAGTGNITPSTPVSTTSKPTSDANPSRLAEPNVGSSKIAQKAAQASKGPSDSTNAPPWMKIALQELQRGVGENKDLARANQYFADLGYPNYKANVQSWCAAFVSWCLKNSGTPYNQQNPLAAKGGYGNWGKSLPKNNIPYGAIVVVAPSHVFFAAGVENGMVRALGGNQGKPGEVKYSNFPLSSIISVAWPPNAGQPGNVSVATSVIQQTQATDTASKEAQKTVPSQLEGNARRLPEPTANRQSTISQQAQQQSPQALSSARDAEVFNLQLQEARTQTKLLTEIRDAVTGQRGDTTTAGANTVNAIGGLNKNQDAQTRLMTAAVESMVSVLTDMKKNRGSKESLADKFPISARK